MLEEYQAVLLACSLTFSLLNERLESMRLNGLNARNESDAASKLRYMWNEAMIETIVQNITRQATAVNLLLTVFQSETISKTYEIMRSQEVKRSLKSVSDDAKSLRDAMSISAMRATNLSTIGSMIGDEEFGFDDLVINSTVYRRAFMKQQSKLELPSIQEDISKNDNGTIVRTTHADPSSGASVGDGAEKQVDPRQKKKKLRLLSRALGVFTRNRGPGQAEASAPKSSQEVRRLLVYLRLDSLPSLFTFIALLGGDRSSFSTIVHRSKSELETVPEVSKRPLEVHGLRMLELTERTSSLMKLSEVDEYTYRDPIVNAFRTFAQLNNIAVSGSVSIVPESSYAETLTSQASDQFSDLVLIPWSDTPEDIYGLDSVASGIQDAFIQKTLEIATTNIAVFFDRGFGGQPAVEPRALSRTVSGVSLRSRTTNQAPISPIADRSHHVYFPFFGGVDDRVALRFVLQLARNSNITVTVFTSTCRSSQESRYLPLHTWLSRLHSMLVRPSSTS